MKITVSPMTRKLPVIVQSKYSANVIAEMSEQCTPMNPRAI